MYDAQQFALAVSLAAQLLGRLSTPSHAAMRAELKIRVQEALNSMDAIDREVLALRHFEMLTNDETATVLGLKKLWIYDCPLCVSMRPLR